MDTIARLLGSGTAAAGTLFQLAVIAATLPQWPECASGLCLGGYREWRVVVDVWRPFVDNAGDGDRAEREPQCPAPGGRQGHRDLAAAPLPDGYDPHAYGERSLFACVLVAWDGTVREVRMLRGTGQAARDRSLVGTIRRSWRFGPDAEDPRPLSWQRVKLSSGMGGAAIYDPPVLE
jgi:hypothetical protein